MLKSILLLIVILFLGSCYHSDNYSITGKLPSDKYSGQYMFIVPLNNPTPDRVDSAMIEGDSFVLNGYSPTPEIFIMRTAPRYRLDLQELLVVLESGNINVYMGAPSWSKGTSLNDSLQKWKSFKMNYDSIHYTLRQKYKGENDSILKIKTKDQLDSLTANYNSFNFVFVKLNKDNVVGQLVQKMAGSSFTSDQKKELNMNP